MRGGTDSLEIAVLGVTGTVTPTTLDTLMYTKVYRRHWDVVEKLDESRTFFVCLT